MNKKTKDVLVVGFALFAMFLGAGNMIFPPTLGMMAGDKYIFTTIGFLLTGIGLPVLGVVATSKAGGTVNHVAKHLGKSSASMLGFVIMLALGPLLAIPRTCAVTYELAIKPNFPSVGPVICALVFFGITLFFTLNPGKVIDKVGAILTPILIVILLVIVITGIVKPVGTPITTTNTQLFLRGFEGGYQTMDALAAILFSMIIIKNINDRGYVENKEQIKLTIIAGIIAAIGLFVVYGGLIYIGATGSGVFSNNLSRVELLSALIKRLLGPWGSFALGLAVSMACLTTAIGLTATAGDYFSGYTDKLSYKTVVYITIAFSAFFAVNGVDTIIEFSVPILSVLYPVTIVLIVMNIFDGFIKYKLAYRGAAIGALIVSLAQNFFSYEDTINKLLLDLHKNPIFANITPQRVNFDTQISIIESLPLASKGFAWIFPSLILGIIFSIYEFYKKKNNKKTALL